MRQTYFLDDWTEISNINPVEFVREVERRYPDMPKEDRLFISLVKEGSKKRKPSGGKKQIKSTKPDDTEWTVKPYSNYLINVLRNVVKHKLEVHK
jgi:hypothetical protein